MSDIVQEFITEEIDKLDKQLNELDLTLKQFNDAIVGINANKKILLGKLKELLGYRIEERKDSPKGFWFATNLNEGSTRIAKATQNNFVGVQRRIFWKDLEQRPGEYIFSELKNDLDFCTANNLYYQVQVIYKSFDGTNPMPEYLQEYSATYAYTNPEGKQGSGFINPWWDDYCRGRLVALYCAIGDYFDKSPNFYGIASQETSVGNINNINNISYSPTKSAKGIVDLVNKACKALPTSYFFLYMNYIEGNNSLMTSVVEEISEPNFLWGGPDILPDNAGLNAHLYPQMKASSVKKIPMYAEY